MWWLFARQKQEKVSFWLGILAVITVFAWLATFLYFMKFMQYDSVNVAVFRYISEDGDMGWLYADDKYMFARTQVTFIYVLLPQLRYNYIITGCWCIY
jgi:uncharacterized membrane protein YkgB